MAVQDLLLPCSGLLIALLTLIQIAPIKINPWSAIAKTLSAVAKTLGRAINKEMMDKLESLDKEMQQLRDATALESVLNCRVRILHFGDETLHGQKHTKEHFDQILRDIDKYEHYCSTHPEFENNVTVLTSARIKEIYQKCLADGDFL